MLRNAVSDSDLFRGIDDRIFDERLSTTVSGHFSVPSRSRVLTAVIGGVSIHDCYIAPSRGKTQRTTNTTALHDGCEFVRSSQHVSQAINQWAYISMYLRRRDMHSYSQPPLALSDGKSAITGQRTRGETVRRRAGSPSSTRRADGILAHHRRFAGHTWLLELAG
jgi:hypothetical protein